MGNESSKEFFSELGIADDIVVNEDNEILVVECFYFLEDLFYWAAAISMAEE